MASRRRADGRSTSKVGDQGSEGVGKSQIFSQMTAYLMSPDKLERQLHISLYITASKDTLSLEIFFGLTVKLNQHVFKRSCPSVMRTRFYQFT
jgi:hypothetical protein